MTYANVLIAIPSKQTMHKELQRKRDDALRRLLANNPGVDMEPCIFTDMFAKGRSIFTAVAAARNALIDKHLRPEHTHVLWVDADLVDYPPDMIVRLLAVAQGAWRPERTVVAPLVLVERRDIFYDVAAFVEHDQPVYAQEPHFGNVLHKPPYFASPADVIECDSVGCCFLAPAWVHRNGSRFAATPFTDHFPVIRQARDEGARVYCARFVVAYHADLPRYGEGWHSEDMFQWYDWMRDETRHGFQIRGGRRPDAGKPRRPRN